MQVSMNARTDSQSKLRLEGVGLEVSICRISATPLSHWEREHHVAAGYKLPRKRLVLQR